jgi:hypothetical protein
MAFFIKVKNFPQTPRLQDVEDAVASIKDFITEVKICLDPLSSSSDADEAVHFKDLTCIEILRAKFHCQLTNFYFRQIMKSKVAGPFIESYPPKQILE